MSKTGVVLGVAALGALAETGIAGYFIRRTLIRSNAKKERTIEMAGTDWEQYIPEIKEKAEWVNSQESEVVSITSDDGLKLHGVFFPGENKKKIMMGFHGYTSSGTNDFMSLAYFYMHRGYSVFLADARAHGKSEGTYIGFGCLDRFDARKWIRYIDDRFEGDCEILLHGISMGGATVLMSSGLNLPKSVKGIISDCGFTSAWEVFSSVLKNWYHLPAFPILHIANQMAKKLAGYGMDECNSKEEVKLSKVPLLLIHGDADKFVPSRMCNEIYENCKDYADKLIIEGASHAEAYYKEPGLYEEKVLEFIEKLKSQK